MLMLRSIRLKAANRFPLPFQELVATHAIYQGLPIYLQIKGKRKDLFNQKNTE